LYTAALALQLQQHNQASQQKPLNISNYLSNLPMNLLQKKPDEHQLNLNLKCQEDLRSKINMLNSQQQAGHELDKATYDQIQSLIDHLKLQLEEKITEYNNLCGNIISMNEEEEADEENSNSIEASSPANSQISNKSNEYRNSTKDENIKEDSSCDTNFENDNASN